MEAEFTLSKQLFLSMDKMKMRYSSLLVTILGFHCHAIKNKIANHPESRK